MFETGKWNILFILGGIGLSGGNLREEERKRLELLLRLILFIYINTACEDVLMSDNLIVRYRFYKQL